MNELGWTLGWLSVQVAALLLPAIGLLALASRRGPASAAWVASLSLAMVVVLGILAFAPVRWTSFGRSVAPIREPRIASKSEPSRIDRPATDPPPERAESSLDPSRAFGRIRLAWGRFEQRAAEPVARVRPWAQTWAWLTLAGSAVGMIRLAVGLWAIGLCRRRGRVVAEVEMVGLVRKLCQQMGIHRPIEIRELPDLTTPATAGWLRPLLLLPESWRGWDGAERRAVVAHELAHVARSDYAAGLVARLADVVYPFHPLVRWMAGRLHLEQELAADALGASFAGGRSSYLRALSKLALEQEGRAQSWPARAFLPARGTLIRRIAMLKDESKFAQMTTNPRGITRPATALGLVALALALASWKAPASAAGDEPSPPIAKPAEVAKSLEPFDVRFIPETMKGVVAFRPAATSKLAGMAGLTPWLRQIYTEMFDDLAKGLKVDRWPGFRKLACEDIESVVLGINFDKMEGSPAAIPKGQIKGQPTHRLMLSGFTIRSVAPFDWLAFLRQWKLEGHEVREGGRVYYRLRLPNDALGPFKLACFLPDDRTLVFDDENWIKQVATREVQQAPAFLRGADWDRVSRSILATVIDNAGDRTSKEYDLARPDDAMVLPLFRGIDRWTIGAADRDEIALSAEATARDPKDATAVATSIESLAKLGLAALELIKVPDGTSPEEARTRAIGRRLANGLLSGLKPEVAGPSIAVHVGGAGTIADVLAIIKWTYSKEQAEERTQQAEVRSKTEKR